LRSAKAHSGEFPIILVVHTEVASLDLARALGLTTIKAELIDFGGQLAIVVSRYDRFVDTEGRIQ